MDSVRLTISLCVLGLCALAEVFFPKRKNAYPKFKHWLGNLSLSVISTACVRFFFPLTAIRFAFIAQEKNYGIFNNFYFHPDLVLLASILLLDLIIYVQHVVFHHIPVLWKLHVVHHADKELDVTSGIRFHPIEIMISMGIKMGAIFLFGFSPQAVLYFEIILNATALFNHSNIHIPKKIDWFLRFFLVTPDMHRVHHSTIFKETNSNFGFSLPWWDIFFKTYKKDPNLGHAQMEIGLKNYRDPKVFSLSWMLLAPFYSLRLREERQNKKSN